ncbi:SDR family oxidoreductase [Acidisoma cellulosilytica]|uniref:SDR family oxidoreductase n=1 Tax=Acidisoma cellulosilyticum TaxID=2802395 RepID=A0A964E6G0_9PROT|nr:SDR family oxidoreductase [Acidisoma cellulosilyticum]MCB8883442.1 SDR family oxidoreductase [Acidisoma cellulosilyticum]
MTKPLVFITGASAGIGQATARVFSAAGYPLLLVARRLDLIEAMGLPNTVAVAADVRDYDAMVAALKQGEDAFGPVDCLINNAGIARLARLDEQDPAEWRDLIDVNCIGVLNGMHAVAGGMKARRHGTIINVSSIAGRKVYPHHDVYGGTKHFVHAVSEGMRQTMSAHDVRVMVISPGVTKSDIASSITDRNAYEFWSKGRDAMDGGIDAEIVGRTMLFAYELPQSVTMHEMTITPTTQTF